MKKKNLIAIVAAAAMLLTGCGSTAASSDATASADQTASGDQIQESGEASADAAESSDAASSDADSWKVIQEYGFDVQDDESENGQMSKLSFVLKSDSLKDEGDYYTVEADFYRAVEIAPNLDPGDTVEITLNEKTGKKDIVKVNEDGSMTGETDGAEYYFLGDPEEDGWRVLYVDSDDRVEDLFYTGTLRISKDCVTAVVLEQKPSEQITEEDLMGNPYYDGVYFNDEGMVLQLLQYGD